jgi:predicted nucleic acid-binding protein
MDPLFDTSVVVGFRLPPPKYLSSVVLQELTAASADEKSVRIWESVKTKAWKQGRLLTPDFDDWWIAGKTLNAILRNEKRLSKKKLTPRHANDFIHSIVRDILIARTAQMHDLLLVTENVADFKMIRRYLAFHWTAAADFFGHPPDA